MGAIGFSEDFFEKLKEELGVQAVILPELTQYRPHEPLAVGWRLKLVDADEPRVIWAVDEVFDARVPSVAAAARRFADSHPDSARRWRASGLCCNLRAGLRITR
jgi:hypothetical protein